MSEILNTCRTCLIKTSKLTSLNKMIVIDGEVLNLTDILYKCSTLKIDTEEELPQKMCIECVSKLSKAFTFRKQCLEADTLLRSEHFRIDAFEIEHLKEDSVEEAESIIETYAVVEDSGELKLDSFNKFENEFDCEVKVEKEDSLSNDEQLYSYCDAEEEDTLYDIQSNLDLNIIERVEEKEDGDLRLDLEQVKVEEKVVRRRRRSTKEYKRLCSICGMVLHSRLQYSGHMSNQHNPETIRKRKESRKIVGNFPCDICGKLFHNQLLYNRHMRIHDPTNPNKCEYCGRVFAFKAVLETHKYSHTGERPFKCDICGKTTKNRSDLNTHVRFHTGERPFKCTICDKAFVTGSHLRSHERTHKIENLFECLTCNKKFKSKVVLKAHNLVHDTSKHKKCTLCDKTFATSKHILKHMLKHPEFVPFHCETCDRKFYSKTVFDTHVRIHHTIEAMK